MSAATMSTTAPRPRAHGGMRILHRSDSLTFMPLRCSPTRVRAHRQTQAYGYPRSINAGGGRIFPDGPVQEGNRAGPVVQNGQWFVPEILVSPAGRHPGAGISTSGRLNVMSSSTDLHKLL